MTRAYASSSMSCAFDFPCTDLISCFRASSRIFTIVIFSSSFQSMMLILLQKSDDTQIPPPESTRPSIRLWVQLKVGVKVLRALRHLLECGSLLRLGGPSVRALRLCLENTDSGNQLLHCSTIHESAGAYFRA